MISTITLENLLPAVFAGMESQEPVKSSHVWLNTINLERGNRYLVEAESGTGKSSLCSFIYGSRGDFSGRILFDGTDTATFNTSKWCELRKQSLAYLPQEMQLFPELTVLENIAIKNRLTNHRPMKWVTDMLEEMEIGDKANSPAAILSVGQQQRAAIIRALCQPFDFLLIDEPVSHLDERNNGIVADIINRAAQAEGAAVIATSVGNKINLHFNCVLKL